MGSTRPSHHVEVTTLLEGEKYYEAYFKVLSERFNNQTGYMIYEP
jgi:hypothetical protein